MKTKLTNEDIIDQTDRWIADHEGDARMALVVALTRLNSVTEERDQKLAGDQRRNYGDIEEAFGRRRLSDLTFQDIKRWHAAMTERRGPTAANRKFATLRRLFSWAVEEKYIQGEQNCLSGRKLDFLNEEVQRERFLEVHEIDSLWDVIDGWAEHCAGLYGARPDAAEVGQQSADIIALIFLTGARKGEVLKAQVKEFVGIGTDRPTWVKPAGHTKSGRLHRVALNVDAAKIVERLVEGRNDPDGYLFPGPGAAGHRTNIDKVWRAMRKEAGLEGVRIHDLRHTAASQMISSGASLEEVGSILGHRTFSMTMRYAHLMDDAQRSAVSKISRRRRSS